MTTPAVELRFNPTDLRPQDLPTFGTFLGHPADAIDAGLAVVRARMVAQMKAEVRGLADPTHVKLLLIADMAWQLLMPQYRKISAPVMADAYFRAFRAADAGDVPASVIHNLAEKHAEKIGEYFHASSRDALADGFNAMVNRQIPAKAAADKVLDAYGLTPRQMRGFANNKQLVVPISSASPLDVKAKTREYIDKSFIQRTSKLSAQEEHNIDEQAKQFAWMWMQDKGRLTKRAQKMWITAHDERVCPVCGPLHGQKVLVGEQFRTKEGNFWSPGLHPNCRCVVRLIENRFQLEKRQPTGHLVRVSKADDDWNPKLHPRGGDPKNRGRFSYKEREPDKPVIEVALPEAEPEEKLSMGSESQGTLSMGRSSGLTMGSLSMGGLSMGKPEQLSMDGETKAEQLSMGAEAESKKLRMSRAEVEENLSRLITPQMEMSMQRTFEQMTMATPPYVKPKPRRRTVYERPTIHIQDDNGHEYPVYAVVKPRELNWRGGQVELNHTVPFTPDRSQALSLANEAFNDQIADTLDYVHDDEMPTEIDSAGNKWTMQLDDEQLLEVVSWAAYRGRTADPDSQVDYDFTVDWADASGGVREENFQISKVAKALGIGPHDFDVRVLRMDEGHDSPDGTTIMDEAGTKAGFENWVTSGRYNANQIQPVEVAHNLSIKFYWLDPDVRETEIGYIGD